MSHATNEHKRSRKPKNKPKPASNSEPIPHPTSRMISNNNNHANESRTSFVKNPKKKMRFLVVKLKGLGCKGASQTASTPAIIRSAAGWEDKQRVNRYQRRRQPLRNQRNLENVAVDVPDVCCRPPGIGIGSDFAPARTRTAAPRTLHRKRHHATRRQEDISGPRFSAFLSGEIGQMRTTHRSAGEIIETLLLQQNLLPGQVLHGYDQYENWRLNVDDMSYEELLDLGDKIGYVGRGLEEEEISSCLKKLTTADKEWRCSICQEKCSNDDIGTLDCGHYHHIECIKQWLLQRNVCPVCKSEAICDKY